MKPDVLCGLPTVRALFDRRPDAVQRLLYSEATRHEAGAWCARLAAARKPYRLVPPDELARAAGTEHHGGIVAVATARPPTILDLTRPDPILPRHETDLLLLLDGVANPHHLGAIARAAAFFGVRGLLLHELPGAALLSTAAHRTAEGGLEYLDLWRTRDLPRALTLLAPHWRAVAFTAEPDSPRPEDLPRDRPLALIIGQEELGPSAAVLAAARRRTHLPGHPGADRLGLTLAQSAAVLLHALLPG